RARRSFLARGRRAAAALGLRQALPPAARLPRRLAGLRARGALGLLRLPQGREAQGPPAAFGRAVKLLLVTTESGWRGGEVQLELLATELAARGHQLAVVGPPGSEILKRL